jgi:hypothetical protein
MKGRKIAFGGAISTKDARNTVRSFFVITAQLIPTFFVRLGC